MKTLIAMLFCALCAAPIFAQEMTTPDNDKAATEQTGDGENGQPATTPDQPNPGDGAKGEDALKKDGGKHKHEKGGKHHRKGGKHGKKGKRGGHHHRGKNMTEEQRAAFKAEIKALHDKIKDMTPEDRKAAVKAFRDTMKEKFKAAKDAKKTDGK